MKNFTPLELFENLNHDIKSPITSIQSIISLLDQPGKERTPAEISEYHQKMLAKLAFLNTSIDTLFDLVLLSENKLELYREFVEMKELLTTFVSRMSVNSYVKFELQLPAKNAELLLVADRDRIQQVLKTIVQLIERLAETGTTSTIKVTTPKNQLSIAISYTGEQIPVAEVDHLFTLEYTFEKQREKKILPNVFVAAELAKLHQGTLTYQRKNNQSGVFTVQFPLKS